ncbi:DNA repair protein RadA [Calderihabitans maritimus]|uniref:DNA repair protein RadA n=1 Tax=Calderihabitans maritimus TaxID=1246530 RepID=UPI000B507A14|nr:DNA repair protein RadA [Calderihabitans maritimus]
MRKEGRRFVCQQCGHETLGWLGRCPSCGEWNTLVQETVSAKRQKVSGVASSNPPLSIVEITTSNEERFATDIVELDRVLGGGILPGSLILVGGDPGIGKSTLLLMVAWTISKKYGTVLYISGEESLKQTRLRAERIGTLSSSLYILTETCLENIEYFIEKLNPVLVIIDSIQTIYKTDLPAAPGTVSQVRECCVQLLTIAKTKNIPIFLIGHVTKEGSLAGPRVLEHMVDAVLYLEGERHHTFRVLRAVKNRFGSTNEIGVFEMKETGLVEVKNPSAMFLAERPLGATGSLVVSSLEGTRPVLFELQALVTPSSYHNARRLATGLDLGRVLLMIAVLEKRISLNLGNQDIYVNIVGGVRTQEAALDLGICSAIASSFKDIPVDPYTLVIGEVGLAGEVRAVSQLEKRVREAEKLGLRRCVLPANNLNNLKYKGQIELIGVTNVKEALEIVLGG